MKTQLLNCIAALFSLLAIDCYATVRFVSINSTNPVAPFTNWTTAAVNIQDAIDAAAAGDIVLVTNGIYASGGEKIYGLTNRVALDKALTVTSVNGWSNTIIQGAFDPVSTNGPAAVRCAWLADGAVLYGFTLENGATLNTGNVLESQNGGGVYCESTNALVSNCLLTNNAACSNGGGIYFGTLKNSLVISNFATFGGGAYSAALFNCTVVKNFTWDTDTYPTGAGVWSGSIRNCIVQNNSEAIFGGGYDDIYMGGQPQSSFTYSDVGQDLLENLTGVGNMGADADFLDQFRLLPTSPCRGTGSALYASGVDFEGQAWSNNPSMGCDEVVVSNRVGPLSVAVYAVPNPTRYGVLAYEGVVFLGSITGLVSSLEWNFGDGTIITNADDSGYHQWTAPGRYTVTFTAYNIDNPNGVSASLDIQVLPLAPVEITNPTVSSNMVQFEFITQTNVSYTVQYTTNLTPPVTWGTLEINSFSQGGLTQFQDFQATNEARFYRVVVH